MRFTALLVGVTASLTLALHASRADDAGTCVNATGDEQIAACTRAINSGRWVGSGLGWAYINRGNAYRSKGDNDRAIADLNEAIRLDPKSAMAFNIRAGTYHQKGDNDRALTDLNEAIRLDPKLAVAFNNRGNAYSNKGDNDRAIADYNEAIRLDPKLANVYYNRGRAYSDKGDNDRAIADLNEAIRLDPKYVKAYFKRGRLYLHRGSLAKAQADFKQANELNPRDAYAALWLDLTERRNNVPSHLAQAAKQLDMTAWPAPVVRLFLGQITPAGLLDAAHNADEETTKRQVCQANFYSGELALPHGTKDEVIRLFRLAAKECPTTFAESEGAYAELKTLGAAP
jgi:tetratricopeptide (TPR) repeat protein